MKVPYPLRLVAAAFLVLLALPVSAQEFSNTDYIYSRAQTVTSGPALVYPAPIAVSTVAGNVTDLNVRLNTLVHTWPDDLDMLLVAPDGTNMIIMSDAGGEADVANVTITLDDEAATQLSDSGPLVTGSFRPLNSGTGDTFDAPAPAPNLANTTLAAFDGVVANGTWNLYIMDDAGGDYGSLVTGWALIINGTTVNSATSRPVPAHVTGLGAGDPYPTTIDVSGLPTTGILDLNVRIDSLTHSFPDDFDVLLVGPDGTNLIIMSDVGGVDDVAGVVLTIDDEAASLLPDGTALVSGSFRPNNVGAGDAFTTPAPAPSTNTALSVFDALNPNGTWSLYVMDDANLDEGAFSGGWSLVFEVTPPAPSEDLIISEFRFRGLNPNGASNEYVEIYNPGASAHTVAGGGTGYAIAASDGVARCVIPNGTVIPSGGHYLCANSVGYALSGYAAANAVFTTDIPGNTGVALFNTSIAANFTLANRMDAVGFTSEANTLYKEGTGIPTINDTFNIDHAFARDQCGKDGSITTFGACSDYEPADTDDNAADFYFVDTNGTSAGAGQRLGAPGPQNLAAPVSHGGAIANARLDECALAGTPPNFVRDFTSDPAQNSQFGTLDLRQTFTNNTGAPLTDLRFRVVDLTTFPAPSGFADLRPRTSTAVVVTVDRTPCGSATSNVTVQGTALEQPPSQLNGGGFNSSFSEGTVTLGTPLANGASLDVRFLFGIQQTGNFKVGLVVEALPGGSDVWYVEGNTETGVNDGSLALTGTEGWRLLSGAYTNQTYDDLLGPIWTQGFTGADYNGPGATSNVYLYDETVPGARTAGYVSIANQTNDIPEGRGHFVYVFADDDLNTPVVDGGFPKVIPQEGTPLALNTTYPFAPVTFTSTGALADDGWNLMGNPSAGTLNWDAGGWVKTNVDNTIYVWDNNAGGGAQYLTWNGTTGGLGNGLIARNQGFWVKATAAGPVLTAPITAFSQGGTFHGLTEGEGGEEAGRTEPAPTVAFRLEGTAGGHALGTSAYAVALPEAAAGLDRYDAYELVPLVSTYLQLYTVATEGEVAGRPFDITAIPADLSGPVEIPLGARAVVGGTMTAAEVTMTWPTLANIPATWTAQLVDRQTGAVIELREQTSYTFSLPSEGLLAPAQEAPTAAGLLPAGPAELAATRGTATDARLVLVFGPSAVTGTEGLPTVYALHAVAPNPVTTAGTLIRFDLPEAVDTRIEVYDMLGRRVATLADGAEEAGRHTARLDASALASGSYVVRMTAGAFVQAQRVTVTR